MRPPPEPRLGAGSSIDDLLDQAVAAINRGDRVTATALAGHVLAVDHGNADAEDLLAAPDDRGEIRRLTILYVDLVDSALLSSRATLDILKTTRPIILRSSFGHTVLANTRALALAKITASTPDPIGGKIWHDTSGEPSGLLEDAAHEVFSTL